MVSLMVSRSVLNCIKCLSAPPCSEGEVRLLRDRVQSCHNQVWGYVCYKHGWSRLDARVVCRELGLPFKG